MKPLPVQGEPLTVVMRVRPMNNKEIKSEAKCIVYPVDDKFIVLRDPNEDTDDILRANRSREKQYIFDHVFSPKASQKEVYETVVEEKNIIDTVLSGFNCTVFAYGATGTGKTHTMLGGDDNPGIMVHTLNSLFRRMQETSDDKRYTVSIAYLEIYNENIRDLLCPDSGSLELREDANGSIIISNLLDISAESTEVVLGMLRMGNTNRTSEPTVANATSSRSHAILKVNVECRTRVSNVVQESHCGSLYMVDLAGSERAAVTQNRGKRLIEGAHINRSLLALANCINALGSNASNYINYRDSKLTRILKEALGGNCKTIMIAHVSPASSSYEETRNTMLYAERTKKIKNKARQNVVDVNHHVTQYLHIIGDLNLQIAKLKEELNRAELGGGGASSIGVENEEVTRYCDRLKSLIMDQRILRQQLLDLEVSLVQTTVEWQQRRSYIREWELKREEFDLATITAPSSAAPSPSPTLGVEVDADPLVPRGHVNATKEGIETLEDDSFFPVPTAVESELSESLLLSPAKCLEPDIPAISELNVESLQETTHSAEATPKRTSCLPNSSPPNSARQSIKRDRSIRIAEKSLVKPRHVLPNSQLLMPLSPEPEGNDSISDQQQENEENLDSGEVTEPPEILVAREDLVILQTKKEKMEKNHKILKKKLRLIRNSIDKTKEDLACADGFLPTKKELVDLLLSFSDVEASSMQQSLSAALLRAHLLQQTFLIQQLLQHSASLLSLLQRQRKLAEKSTGTEGISAGVAKDWDLKLSEASEKQRKLATQVAELSSIKSDGFPTNLTESATGFKFAKTQDSQGLDSKSLGLFAEASDIHLPDIVQVKDDTAEKKYSIESSTLPPITTVKAPGTFGKAVKPTEKKVPTNNQSSPLKRSEIDQIVKEAKRNRDRRNAVNLGDKAKRTSMQFQERTVLPLKKSYRVPANQVVTTRSLVMGQSMPTASEVIDLETSAAPVTTHSESKGRLRRSDSSQSLFQGKKSQSHSNLSAAQVPDPHRNDMPVPMGENERNRRRRIVNRVGSVSSSKSLPGTIENKKKRSTQATSRNRVIMTQNPVPPDEEWARKTKYWGATAKPLVKKIAFSQRPNSQISPHPLTSSSGVVDSDSNSTSEKGLTTDDSTTDTTSQPTRRKSRQRTTLTRQPWRNRRRHGILPHNSQLTMTKYPLAPRKQLSLAKVVAGNEFSNIESPYRNAFPNANKSGTRAQGNTPRRKPLVRSQFPGDFSKT